MTKTFPIDFVRQIIEQTLFEEHNANPSKYFGGKNQVNLFSFYEQLQKEDEVNRYVEIYRDLSEQQNRTGLIMNGTIIAPENPTITNLYQCLIIPMTFTCSFRVKLENRDTALKTINNLIKILKGRKRDVAELDTGELFVVGTIGESSDGAPQVVNGDYVLKLLRPAGLIPSFDSQIKTKLNTLAAEPYAIPSTNATQIYCEYASQIIPFKLVNGDWTMVESQDDIDILMPPEHSSFTKYKVSLSFDSIRCDEPRNLNNAEYCVISFGGSATLVNDSVKLGNDLVKLSITRSKILASPQNVTFNEQAYWLEPLELPNSNSADTQVNQLISNNFVNNTHTDSISISMQYTFIYDDSIWLLDKLFEYSRYGIQGTELNSYVDGITPNTIYALKEIWSIWGNVKAYKFNTKVVESIDIENTESDTLTITIPMQLQGDNN